MNNEPRPNDPSKLEACLPEALETASRVEEPHFEFDDLTRLADARREHGENWDMPPHLSRCSLCLEMFQIILEGVSSPSADALKRFTDVRKNGQAETPNVVPFATHWKPVLQIAAAVALLLVAFGLFQMVSPKPSAHVSTGTITLPDGKMLPSGAGIPNGVVVTATEATSASLNDGSKIDLVKDTQVSFRQSSGDTLISLNQGELTASVPKQKTGNNFVVRTPLGEVVVVGTKFSVTCHPEEVVVYESVNGVTKQRKDMVRATRIAVTEGVVRVHRGNEHASVAANQTAVLRESQPDIEVVGTK